jgi:hypothetical protein
VTAVTTAGLLAGLFGSAFVPAARADAELTAADNSSTLRCVASATDADVEVQGNAGGTCYAAAGSTVTIDVVINGGTEEVGDWFNVILDGSAGATIVGYTADDEVRGFTLVNSNNTVNMSLVAAAADELEFRVQVKAPANGGSYTYTLYDGAAATTALETLTIVGAAAGTANVTSASKSKVSKPCYAFGIVDNDADATLDGVTASADNDVVFDGDGDVEAATDASVNDLLAAGGSTCLGSDIATVAAGDNYVLQIQVLDAFGNAVTSDVNGQIRATVTGPAGVLLSDTYTTTAAVCADDTSKTDVLGHTDASDYVCLLGDGDSGVATLTITSGSWSVTRTVRFLGSVDSITISGPSHMTTNDSNTDVAFQDALSVICKDDAGTIIGDGGANAADEETAAYYLDGDVGACDDDNLDFSVKDSVGASVNTFLDDNDGTAGAIILPAARVALEFSDENNGATVATSSEMKNGYWDIPSGVCAEGKEGSTRTVTVSYTSLLIDSNAITITCVANKVKITSLTALATGTSGSATSGKNGQTIKVSVAATDGYGRPAGAGATFSFTATKSNADATFSAGTSASFAAGTATLTITLGTTSGAQYVIYSATDSDTVTTGSQAFAQKISFTVANDADALSDYSLTTKGSKVTGSNFSARATVKVEVENATKGTVKVFTRKANAAGNVVYTVAGRGTFYVTMYTGAAGAEVLSNTVTVKR